jgi:hypothetical protein
MRTVVTVALVTLMLSADWGAAQTDALQGGNAWVSNVARSVSVSRSGVVMATLVFPAGTFLEVSYDKRQPSVLSEGHWEFHGNFVLRAQLARDMPPPGGGLQKRMSDAPLVLTGQGMDVFVENVRP